MRKFYKFMLAFAVGGLFTSAARADFQVTLGTDNQGTDNVLFTTSRTGVVTEGFNYVIGGLNANSPPLDTALVEFNSNEQIYVNNGNGGQAAIYAVDGGFNVMSIFFTNPADFLITKLDLNIDATGSGGQVKFFEGTDAGWTFALNGTGTGGTRTLDANGQNKFIITSVNGITALSFLVSGGANVSVTVDDLEQVRIGGIPPSSGGNDSGGAPLPKTAWAGIGLLGMLGAGRFLQSRRPQMA